MYSQLICLLLKGFNVRLITVCRIDKEKEDRRTSFSQYVESAGDDDLACIEELLKQRKRQRVSGGQSAQGCCQVETRNVYSIHLEGLPFGGL